MTVSARCVRELPLAIWVRTSPAEDYPDNDPSASEGVEPHFRELEPAERVAAADGAPSTSGVSARIAPFLCFAPVEDPEHQNGAAIAWVLEGVRAPEALEQEFAVFLAASYVNDRDLADPEDGFVIVQAE